ncbi:MAG: YihY family inner membrane protein [Rhodospirillales bacterium]
MDQPNSHQKAPGHSTKDPDSVAGEANIDDTFASLGEDPEDKIQFSERLREIGKDVPGFAAYVWDRFREDRCWRMAAGLGYTSLLALVPLSAIAFAMLAAFPVFGGLREQFQDILFANLLPQSAEAMRTYFDQFIRNTTTLSAVGVIGLAATAILLLGTIEADLNAIFRVRRPRPLIPRLLVFWAVISLGPLVVGASFSLATYFFVATQWLQLDGPGGALGFLGVVAPSLIIILGLIAFYMVIPNRPVAFSSAAVGAIVAGVLFALLRRVFAWYVVEFPTYENVYGALSAVPIFLVWMYLSWSVVLLGAVLTASFNEWHSAGGRPQPLDAAFGARLRITARLLGALHEASRGDIIKRNGAGLGRRALLKATGISDVALDSLLVMLRRDGFIELGANKRWLLVRDLDNTTLGDLMATIGMDFSGRDDSNAPETAVLVEYLAKLETAQSDVLAAPLRKVLDGGR